VKSVAEEIYTILTIFMLMGTVQTHILRMYFSCSELIAMPVSDSVSSVHRFESICKFLHFIDNSYQDTYERPQKLFKMCPIIRHLNSKFNKTYESLTLCYTMLPFTILWPYIEKNGHNDEHLKFRINFDGGFLVTYTVQCKISGNNNGDNNVRRLKECPFPI